MARPLIAGGSPAASSWSTPSPDQSTLGLESSGYFQQQLQKLQQLQQRQQQLPPTGRATASAPSAARLQQQQQQQQRQRPSCAATAITAVESAIIPAHLREHAQNIAKWFPEVFWQLGAPDLESTYAGLEESVREGGGGCFLQAVLKPHPTPQAAHGGVRPNKGQGEVSLAAPVARTPPAPKATCEISAQKNTLDVGSSTSAAVQPTFAPEISLPLAPSRPPSVPDLLANFPQEHAPTHINPSASSSSTFPGLLPQWPPFSLLPAGQGIQGPLAPPLAGQPDASFLPLLPTLPSVPPLAQAPDLADTSSSFSALHRVPGGPSFSSMGPAPAQVPLAFPNAMGQLPSTGGGLQFPSSGLSSNVYPFTYPSTSAPSSKAAASRHPTLGKRLDAIEEDLIQVVDLLRCVVVTATATCQQVPQVPLMSEAANPPIFEPTGFQEYSSPSQERASLDAPIDVNLDGSTPSAYEQQAHPRSDFMGTAAAYQASPVGASAAYQTSPATLEPVSSSSAKRLLVPEDGVATRPNLENPTPRSARGGQAHQGVGHTEGPGAGRSRQVAPNSQVAAWRSQNEEKLKIAISKVDKLQQEPNSPKFVKPSKVWKDEAEGPATATATSRSNSSSPNTNANNSVPINSSSSSSGAAANAGALASSNGASSNPASNSNSNSNSPSPSNSNSNPNSRTMGHSVSSTSASRAALPAPALKERMTLQLEQMFGKERKPSMIRKHATID